MRKKLTYTVSAEGRDKGKVFILTEMPASQAERWAMRAFLALARGGVELPDNIASMGMAGIASVGLGALAHLDWRDAQPLVDEMFECVQIQPDPKKPSIVRALVEDDIEEVATRLKLRAEVFKLHTDFSAPAAP